MTERYSHLAKDTLKNAVKKFENSLNAEKQKKLSKIEASK